MSATIKANPSVSKFWTEHSQSGWLRRTACGAVVTAAACLLAIGAGLQASAQTFTVLHNFNGTDGAAPQRGLIVDKTGNLYGTTPLGGPSNVGNVFKIDPNGNETVVLNFTSGNGPAGPYSGLIRDSAGNLYGTSSQGGSHNIGTVFKIAPAGDTTVLYSFTGADGENPYSGLAQDAAGNLYGTTYVGGSKGYGTVFMVDPGGNLTVLYNFAGGADGAYPLAKLALDGAGNIYGTTAYGGASNLGMVFKIDAQGSKAVLHIFSGADGANPFAGVTRAASGMLYGTTWAGGAMNIGTVYKIDPAGHFSMIYSFSGLDGAHPHAEPTLDAAGNLFSTTFEGGTANQGTVFKIDTAGNETVLHSLTGQEGAAVTGELALDGSGNLYGTAALGGTANLGTVFKLSGAVSGFNITPSPSTESVPRGSFALFLLKITPANGFTGRVQLSCSGGPAGTVCVNIPQTVYVKSVAWAVIGVFFPANTAPGTYNILFTGGAGTMTTSATARIIVK